MTTLFPVPAPSSAEIAQMPADEALFFGAALAHVALFRERQRLARIDQQNRMAFESHQRARRFA